MCKLSYTKEDCSRGTMSIHEDRIYIQESEYEVYNQGNSKRSQISSR